MKKNRVFSIVCGMSGNGKTFLIQNYIIPILARKKPVLVLDIMNEYKGIKYAGFDPFLESVKKAGQISRGVHVIKWKSSADAVKLIHFARRLERPLSIILEESHVLFNDSDLYRAIKKPLHELTLFGRHFSADVVLSTQRPALISTTMRSQAQFFISFRQEERADLEYLSVREAAAREKVATLQKKQFFSFGQIPGIFPAIKNREINQLNKKDLKK